MPVADYANMHECALIVQGSKQLLLLFPFMRHAHADGKAHWPFEAGCSKCERKISKILCPFNVSSVTSNKGFNTNKSHTLNHSNFSFQAGLRVNRFTVDFLESP